MSDLSPKERLSRVLHKQPVDRPPVICVGGMMNAAIVEIMQETGHTLPAAHFDSGLMASLAQDVQKHTGFENFAVPFCMTIEAEILGSEIDPGSLACEPKIRREILKSVKEAPTGDVAERARSGRIRTVVKAARSVASANADIPVIGSLTGPVSTAASVVDPMTFYKELRKESAAAHQFLDYVTRLLGEYAEQLVKDGGASAIAVGDPSATGEILGPAMFEQYALRYLNQLADRVHALGVPFIIHICGDVKRVRPELARLRADALSVDAMVNLAALKAEYPHITTMGNLSTYALQWSAPEKIAQMTENLVRDGIDIISPACGLSTSTTTQRIRAMTDAVKTR